MGDTQNVFLRWTNHKNNINKNFKEMLDKEEFVDVTLVCEGRSIKAHRVILSSCSSYIYEFLKKSRCNNPVIVLQDVAFIDLNALVELIYNGEVIVHRSLLDSFLKTAETLKVCDFNLDLDSTDNRTPIRFTEKTADISKMGHDAPPRKDTERVEDYSSDNVNNLLYTNPSDDETDTELMIEPTDFLRLEYELPSDENNSDSVGDHENKDMSSENKIQGPQKTGTKILCQLCGTSLANASSLKRHIDSIHNLSDTSFACEFCGRTYKSKNSLITHKSLHHRTENRTRKRIN